MSLGRLAPGEPSEPRWESARLGASPRSGRDALDSRFPEPSSPSHPPSSASDPFSRFARRLLDDVTATLFPGDCRVCDEPLLRASRLPVCNTCLAAPRPQRGALCAVCGEALGFEAERTWELAGAAPLEELCTACRRLPPPFLRAVSFGVYEQELRLLLHLFKYDRMHALAAPLGSMLARALANLAPDLAQGAILVPVPLHAEKLRERGFNQTESMARAAARELATRLRLDVQPNLLVRTRATESQFGLNPRQRRENLKDAFAPGPAPALRALQGRDVIVVDDIFTTGATARACAHVLRSAGAARVYVATLARAQPEMVASWEVDDA